MGCLPERYGNLVSFDTIPILLRMEKEIAWTAAIIIGDNEIFD